MVGAVVHPGEEERGGARTCAIPYLTPSAVHELLKASVLMQILSYPSETALSNKLTWNRIVLSFKDSPRQPLGRRPSVSSEDVLYSIDRYLFGAHYSPVSVSYLNG